MISIVVSSGVKERNKLTLCAKISNVAPQKMFLTLKKWPHQTDLNPTAREFIVQEAGMRIICGSVTLSLPTVLNLLSSHVQVPLITSVVFSNILTSWQGRSGTHFQPWSFIRPALMCTRFLRMLDTNLLFSFFLQFYLFFATHYWNEHVI